VSNSTSRAKFFVIYYCSLIFMLKMYSRPIFQSRRRLEAPRRLKLFIWRELWKTRRAYYRRRRRSSSPREYRLRSMFNTINYSTNIVCNSQRFRRDFVELYANSPRERNSLLDERKIPTSVINKVIDGKDDDENARFFRNYGRTDICTNFKLVDTSKLRGKCVYVRRIRF